GTADRNRSHWSTSKTPSYTKSVSWQHHQVNEICEQARHYLVEKMFETHSLDMNNSVLASPEDL
ncbi:hypothetical protein SNB73_18735, partial [Escherichia coli]|nr:hypothetical protein [Escherichia coli]